MGNSHKWLPGSAGPGVLDVGRLELELEPWRLGCRLESGDVAAPAEKWRWSGAPECQPGRLEMSRARGGGAVPVGRAVLRACAAMPVRCAGLRLRCEAAACGRARCAYVGLRLCATATLRVRSGGSASR
jgi:hypothetical protein